MEANWSSYLSNMNARDFAHTFSGTRMNPLNAEQVEAIETKLLLFTLQAGPIADTIQRDPEAKRNFETICEKVVNERRFRVFYGFKTDGCERMESLIIKLQSLFESVYPGLVKFKGVYTPPSKNAVEEPRKLPPVEIVDENLLKISLVCLSGLDDLKNSGKIPTQEDLAFIKQLLIKVSSRLENYPKIPISDEILKNVARLFENVNEVLLYSELQVFRLCVERNIAVPRQILHQLSTRCRYNEATMKLIAQQLDSGEGTRSELFKALEENRRWDTEDSHKMLSKSFKAILAFAERDRTWVVSGLECLNQIISHELPEDACPEVREFFRKEVLIQFLDETVLCTHFDILWFCTHSPGLYSVWKKNLEYKTPGMDFKQLGITYGEYAALKEDCRSSDPHLGNSLLGMALGQHLELCIEWLYAGEAVKDSKKHANEICEAYRKGFVPDFTKFPNLRRHVAGALGEKIAASVDDPAKLMECLLIGSKIARESSKETAQIFVFLFFARIPEVIATLRRATEEQLFEDVQDCEHCLRQIVSLLESFECCYNLGPAEFIGKYLQINESLLAFNKIHPIPDVLDLYRKKLSAIISVDLHTEIYQALIPSMMTISDPWLLQKFTEVTLARLRGVSPGKLVSKRKYINYFETAVNLAMNSECVKEVSKVLHPFFASYVRKIWMDFLYPRRPEYFGVFQHELDYFRGKIAKIGKLQAATLSDEDEFILLAPKLELDLRDCLFNKDCFDIIAAHLKVDKVILKKRGWFDKEGLTSDECDEVEKIFAKFPKGTIVWM